MNNLVKRFFFTLFILVWNNNYIRYIDEDNGVVLRYLLGVLLVYRKKL